MLNLPKTTEFNKKIPKKKFYENLTVSPALKKVFVEQVKGIYWRHKIAVSTMNIAPGSNVTELEIFEVLLNSPTLDDSFLRQIDKQIPYHILFLLEYEGKQKAVIGYKEESAGNAAFKVNRYYYSTDWLEVDSFALKADGLSVDTIYENFIRQIAGVGTNPLPRCPKPFRFALRCYPDGTARERGWRTATTPSPRCFGSAAISTSL